MTEHVIVNSGYSLVSVVYCSFNYSYYMLLLAMNDITYYCTKVEYHSLLLYYGLLSLILLYIIPWCTVAHCSTMVADQRSSTSSRVAIELNKPRWRNHAAPDVRNAVTSLIKSWRNMYRHSVGSKRVKGRSWVKGGRCLKGMVKNGLSMMNQ